MSDKEDYPKEETSAGEQPKTHHQRKPWQKRNQVYPHQQKKDSKEIPVLQYGPNSNFHIYKKINGMRSHEALWKFRKVD